jgi:hypothetical protein
MKQGVLENHYNAASSIELRSGNFRNHKLGKVDFKTGRMTME